VKGKGRGERLKAEKLKSGRKIGKPGNLGIGEL
jgi:hypothetical protein